MRYAAMLAAIPPLVFGAVALSRPSPSPPLPVKPVQTEGVRVVRMDSETFRARWRPIYYMPPLAIVRGGDAQPHERTSKPVDVAASAPPPPAARIVKRASLRPTDICARHGMRKQFYRGRGGWQHWRCRR